ncbi:MAG: tetratricopeptide repeat protein, partial [Isosphaeraceae bacterium]
MMSPTWKAPARRTLLIVALAVPIVAGAATVAVRLLDRDARTARRALAEGRLDDASAALDRWLRSSPRSAEAHFLRARIAWERNDLPTVHEELDRARSLGYPERDMAGLLGLLLARTNQSSRAEPYLRTVFEASRSTDPRIADALARIYLGTFRLKEAEAVLDRWSREIPADARPYLLRVEVDRRLSRSSDAVAAGYREALRRDPSLDQARLGLAEVLRGAHRNAEAAEEYTVYLAHKPNDPLGYLGAGQNALEMGELEKAVEWLERSLELSPRNPVTLAARASVELRRNRFVAALGFLDRAVEVDPFDQANRFQRMLVLTRLGRREQAESERRAVERIRADQQEFQRISDALVASPVDPELRSGMARWLMAHGHEDEAVDWAKLVLADHASDPAMNRLLADYYRRRGQT